MITVVRIARVLLILVLAFLMMSMVIAVATPDTGALEKVVLAGLIALCVYAAAKVSTLAERTVRQLERR